jgi:enoyl-[acyl-carrier-protein] reductase (NADH)
VGYLGAFLSSPLAAGITGTVVHADNGYHAMGMGVTGPGTIDGTA